MASRKRSKRSISRRFFWFTLLIVLAIAAYTFGWFYAARTLEAKTAAIVGAFNMDGRRAHCETPTARGYPFRIGLFCQSVFYEDASEGFSVRAGAFRSAAQVYQPWRIVGELDGPARFALSRLEPILARWETLRLSARLTATGPERLSAEAKQVALAVDDERNLQIATLDKLQVHTRRNGNDYDLAMIGNKLAIAPALTSGRPLPPVEAELLITLENETNLDLAELSNLQNRSGRLTRFAMRTEDNAGGFTLSGPFEIDAQGFLSAELNGTFENAAAITKLVAEIFPEQKDRILALASGLAGLGESPTLPINIRKGRIFVGFLPIGEIPPVR